MQSRYFKIYDIIETWEENIMPQIKDILRTLRNERDAKQSTVANDIGLAQGTYSSYENGITPPTENCIKIAKYFDVSVDYLLGLTN